VEFISISASRSSLNLISHYLLIILATDYCSKKTVNNFGLRRLFYSRQGFKNIYHSPICTGHKRTNSTELIFEKIIYIYIFI